MNIRQIRLRTIAAILNTQLIPSQEALQVALQKEGLQVTQATLSRDLKALKVVKTTLSDGSYQYIVPTTQPTPANKTHATGTAIARGALKSIDFSGQFVVIKTRPGYASAVAYDVDNRGVDMILGTIAGDDTILVIPRDGVEREALSGFLYQLWQ